MDRNLDIRGLKLQLVDNETEITVVISGRLETDNSIGFLKFLDAAITDYVTLKSLILDMEELDYMSSTGIGALTTLLVNTKKKNITLTIRNIQPKVKSVMDLLGFSSFFNFSEVENG